MKPVNPLCSHEALYCCSRCGRCPDCCVCESKPAPALVHTDSKAAAEIWRRLRKGGGS